MRRARLEKYREAVRSSQCYGCATAVLSTILVVLVMCIACILYGAFRSKHPLYIARKILHQHTLRYYEYESKSTGTQQATAYLVNQKYKIMGTVRLYSEGGGVRIVAQMNGLEPNSRHGFKVTEFSDLENGNGEVYNNEGKDVSHGCPDTSKTYRAGDLGNLVADNTGAAFYDWKSDKISLSEVIGRTVIVDIEEDDCVSTSGSSNPLAQGSIGLENVDSLSGHNDKNSAVRNNPLKRAHLRHKYKSSLSSHGDFMDVSSSPIWGHDNDDNEDDVGIDRKEEGMEEGMEDGDSSREEEYEQEETFDEEDYVSDESDDDDDDDLPNEVDDDDRDNLRDDDNSETFDEVRSIRA